MFETQLLSVLSEIKLKLDITLKEIESLKAERDRDFATIPEVAATFGVSDTAVRKKVRSGELDPVSDCRYDAAGRLKYIKRAAFSKLHFRKKIA
jgi:hypothetical protein